MIILTNVLLDVTWAHCPSHSLAEGPVQYLSVHIDTIIMLEWLDCDIGK